MSHILPTSPNQTVGEEIADHYSAYSKPLSGPLSRRKHYGKLYGTDGKRQFVVYEHVLFFTIYFWKTEDIFLYIIEIFCVYS